MKGHDARGVNELLTPREREVLALIQRGFTNRGIADALAISLAGAKFHVSEIISKLGVQSREEAAAWRSDRQRWRFLVPFTILRRGVDGLLASKPAIYVSFGVILVAGLVSFALFWSGLAAKSGEESALNEIPTVPPSSEAQLAGPYASDISGLPPIGVSASAGKFLSLQAGVLTLRDNNRGGLSFAVTEQTRLIRAEAHRVVVDTNLALLRPGDDVLVGVGSGNMGTAEAIVRGYFKYQAGLFAGRGENYIDVRLNLTPSSRPPEYALTTTRFWVDPAARIEAQNGLRRLENVAQKSGTEVMMEGLIGDDGAPVAVFVRYVEP